MLARSTRSTLALAGLVALVLSGCGKKSPTAVDTTGTGGSAADQAAITSTVASTTALVDDGLMEANDQALFSAAPTGSAAAIKPLRFWRRITSIKRSFDFAVSDTDTTGRPTRAIVTVHKVLSGTFNIAFDATPNDTMRFDSVATVSKPLNDLWVRKILLRRVHRDAHGDMVMGSGPEEGHDGRHDDEWKVAGISGVDVRSFDPSQIHEGPAYGLTAISSIHIQSASLDTTIMDPLQFYMLRRIHSFGPAEDVTLTVTTGSNTDVVVLVRAGMRRRFTNNGDKTYTLTWHTSAEGGVRHFGVNALSNGTLFDDQSPYDSDAWIFPYVIRPNLCADYLP
ncbi:MAG: hypothetical protein ACRENS_06915 [Candidatus Eiseniibacteriota bacterium]